MFRSLIPRSGTSGTRTMSTGSPQKPPPADTATPKVGAKQAPPAPPQPRSSFVRRATPLLIGAGTGFFFYKSATDNEFRESVVKSFPASESLMNLIPVSSSATPKSVVETSKAVEAEGQTNLPPGYDSVPELLRKIEESKVSLTGSENDADGTKDVKDQSSVAHSHGGDSKFDAKDLRDMTPSERVASRTSLKSEDSSGLSKDGPISTRIQEKASGATLSKASAIVTTNAAAEAKPTLTEIMTTEENGSGKPDSAAEAATATTGASGKEKLARVLGKGDFRADQVKGGDVVDSSVYQKPKAWSSKSTSERPVESKPSLKKTDVGTLERRAVPEVDDKARAGIDAEISALRAELESQTKWEAVRLQEAVRAQIVEDKKIAAKEAAEMAKKHAEEMERVREQAMVEAQKMLKVKSAELKTKAEAERDAELGRLLKAKEELLREELNLEYSTKEREETVEREKALVNAKVHVMALEEKFDGVVLQTEKAKEASKRASAAFMLRETVSSCRPLGKHLCEAGGNGDLGNLVVTSVPDSAVQSGVQSIDSLRESFHRASRRGLSVALVPEGRTGTIWGHLLGAIFSRLKIPVDIRDDGEMVAKTNEGRIRLAGRLVEEGDIGGAITTLEGLKGLSAEVMSDWLGAAKARVAADLAADVLLADAIIAQLALTGGVGGENKISA